MVVITYFSEVMGNATRTLIWNAALIKKIFLPREMFPVASVYVAIVHFVPQLVVLLVGSLFYDWRPTLLGTAAILAGFVIVTFAALGLGLIFGCLNVFFRDSENLVDLILMIATWVSPVLYPADKVKDVVPEWMWHIYQANPVTVAVELFHYGFWSAATGESVPGIGSIPMLTLVGLVGSLIGPGAGAARLQAHRGQVRAGAVMDPRIEIAGVTKEFTLRHRRSLKELAVAAVRKQDLGINTFKALDDVTFDVHQGETVALLGFNGSGKSTLLKLISGVLRPDGGRIRTRGRVAGLIEVGAGFHPDLTGRENVFLNGAILGMTKKQIEDAYESIVEFSEIPDFMDTEVKFYSSGMFLRLAFAVAVHSDPEVFLIDEILAVGDEPFQRKCLDEIRGLSDQGKTLVIVSHDLNMVSDLCERGVLLDKGVKVADGPSKDVVRRMRGE